MLALAFTSCKNLVESPSFDVTIDPDAIISVENGIYVCKKDYVKFKFSGNPDILSFYTGERGSEYVNKDRTTLNGNPYLQFTGEALNGTSYTLGGKTYAQEYDSLRVYVSTVFSGITRNSTTDSQNLLKSGIWIDVTSKLNLPKLRATASSPTSLIFSGKLDLSAYKEQPLYVAFHFACRPSKTTNNTDYRISGFRIYNENQGITDTLHTTKTMGWSPFNFIIKENPYAADLNVDAPVPAGYHRTWVLSDLGGRDRLRIRGSAGQTNSDDWIISSKIDLMAASPDKPVSIKGFEDGYMSTFSYVYDKTGTYTVTFIANNSKGSELKSAIKEIKVKIID